MSEDSEAAALYHVAKPTAHDASEVERVAVELADGRRAVYTDRRPEHDHGEASRLQVTRLAFASRLVIEDGPETSLTELLGLSAYDGTVPELSDLTIKEGADDE